MINGRGLASPAKTAAAVATGLMLTLFVGCSSSDAADEFELPVTTELEPAPESTPPTTLEPLAVESTQPPVQLRTAPAITVLTQAAQPDDSFPTSLSEGDERSLIFRHESETVSSESVSTGTTGPTSVLELDLFQHFDTGDGSEPAKVITTVEAGRLDGSVAGLESLAGVWFTQEIVGDTWSALAAAATSDLTPIASNVIGPVRQTFEELGHLYPTGPVGVGSQWQVTDSNDVGGLPALSITTVTVIASSEGQLDATIERVISFESGPIQLDSTNGTLRDTTESRTSGIISWRDGFPLPLISLETVTEFHVDVEDGSSLTTIINQRQEVAIR